MSKASCTDLAAASFLDTATWSSRAFLVKAAAWALRLWAASAAAPTESATASRLSLELTANPSKAAIERSTEVLKAWWPKSAAWVAADWAVLAMGGFSCGRKRDGSADGG